MKSIGKSGCCTNHLGAGWRRRNTCQYMFSGMISGISQNISLFLRNPVHPVRTSSKCNFSQCHQLFSSEKILQRPFCLHRTVDLSFFHTLDQVFRLNIYHLYLICLIKHTVRNTLFYFYIRNIPYQIIETFQMLDIHCGIYIDPCAKQLPYILIALFIPASADIGMGELIHQDQLWFSLQRRIQIKLPKLDSFIIDHKGRNFFHPLCHCLCIRTCVRFDITCHYIHLMPFCLMGSFQHGVCLTGSCRISKKNFQFSLCLFLFFLLLVL